MDALRISITNNIHKIVLNSPKTRNALSLEMYEKITNALNSTSNNESVVATVITGTGDFYSSGNNLKGYLSDGGFDFEKQSLNAASVLEKFVASFVNHTKILIAVVNGPAIGIAATTIALCDYVIASDKAYFLTPFTKLGLSPEGCSTYTFSRVLGTRMATEMLLFNRKLTAQEAFNYRFVNKILPHARINDAWPLIDDLLSASHQSLISSKRLLRDSERTLLLEANTAECKALVERWKSEDFVQQLMNYLNRKSKL